MSTIAKSRIPQPRKLTTSSSHKSVVNKTADASTKSCKSARLTGNAEKTKKLGYQSEGFVVDPDGLANVFNRTKQGPLSGRATDVHVRKIQQRFPIRKGTAGRPPRESAAPRRRQMESVSEEFVADPNGLDKILNAQTVESRISRRATEVPHTNRLRLFSNRSSQRRDTLTSASSVDDDFVVDPNGLANILSNKIGPSSGRDSTIPDRPSDQPRLSIYMRKQELPRKLQVMLKKAGTPTTPEGGRTPLANIQNTMQGGTPSQTPVQKSIYSQSAKKSKTKLSRNELADIYAGNSQMKDGSRSTARKVTWADELSKERTKKALVFDETDEVDEVDVIVPIKPEVQTKFEDVNDSILQKIEMAERLLEEELAVCTEGEQRQKIMRTLHRLSVDTAQHRRRSALNVNDRTYVVAENPTGQPTASEELSKMMDELGLGNDCASPSLTRKATAGRPAATGYCATELCLSQDTNKPTQNLDSPLELTSSISIPSGLARPPVAQSNRLPSTECDMPNISGVFDMATPVSVVPDTRCPNILSPDRTLQPIAGESQGRSPMLTTIFEPQPSPVFQQLSLSPVLQSQTARQPNPPQTLRELCPITPQQSLATVQPDQTTPQLSSSTQHRSQTIQQKSPNDLPTYQTSPQLLESIENIDIKLRKSRRRSAALSAQDALAPSDLFAELAHIQAQENALQKAKKDLQKKLQALRGEIPPVSSTETPLVTSLTNSSVAHANPTDRPAASPIDDSFSIIAMGPGSDLRSSDSFAIYEEDDDITFQFLGGTGMLRAVSTGQSASRQSIGSLSKHRESINLMGFSPTLPRIQEQSTGSTLTEAASHSEGPADVTVKHNHKGSGQQHHNIDSILSVSMAVDTVPVLAPLRPDVHVETPVAYQYKGTIAIRSPASPQRTDNTTLMEVKPAECGPSNSEPDPLLAKLLCKSPAAATPTISDHPLTNSTADPVLVVPRLGHKSAAFTELQEKVSTLKPSSPMTKVTGLARCTVNFLEALLDDEISIYTCRTASSVTRRDSDPLSRLLLGGDDQHFIPIPRDGTGQLSVNGSAFHCFTP